MNVILRTFAAFQNRKSVLFICATVIAGLFLVPLWGKRVDMDIRVMLPEGKGGMIKKDLELLARSPLASNVFILVHSEEDTPEALAQAADDYIAAMADSDLEFVNLAAVNYAGALAFLVDNAPFLMGEEDLARFSASLEPESLRKQLRETKAQLTSFQGMALKDLIHNDPLALRSILAGRFGQFADLSQIRLTGGRIVSSDGRNLLLTARTTVPVTDAAGSARIVEQAKAAAHTLPRGISAELISGHPQAAANAETLRSDLALISIVSPLFFVGLFLTLIRKPRALVLYFTPLAALAAATGSVAWFSQTVSAVVLAFGAVLLGIAEDYGMYVYFALAKQPERPAEALAAVARPVLFTAATTCAGFAVFLFSDTPGQRQLAVYFLAGLGMSVLFSLFVLPHIFGHLPAITIHRREVPILRRHATFTAGICALLVVVCFTAALRLRFDADLRNLGVMPQSLRLGEQHLSAAFGDIRRQAVLFVSGANEQEAMERNERAWNAIRRNMPGTKAVSLAPLLPMVQTQHENLSHWREFWGQGKALSVQKLLANEATALGFSDGAFKSVEDAVKANPPLLSLTAFQRYGLSAATSCLCQTEVNGSVTLLTLLPDTEEVLTFFTPEREAELGARLVSTTRLRKALEATMRSEIIWLLGGSAASVALLLALLYRDIRRVFLAATPSILGLVAVLGWLGATTTPLNIFHVAALPLVIGMGVGFGIFQVSSKEASMPLATEKAMFTTGLSTLGGFGALALARHPALHAMGLTVLVGVGVALAAALLVLPQFLGDQA